MRSSDPGGAPSASRSSPMRRLVTTSSRPTSAAARVTARRYRGTTENCGFHSFQQCLAAISGVGGMCVLAPMQTQIIEVKTRMGGVGPRRSIRDAIDQFTTRAAQ